MSSVEETLKEALTYMFLRIEMAPLWAPLFPEILSVFREPWLGRDHYIGRLAEVILANHTEQEVVVTLAKFRLEGKWKPE